MTVARAGSSRALLTVTALVTLVALALRVSWQPRSGLDTGRQTRPPQQDLPGAGKVPVTFTTGVDGRRLRHAAGESAVPLRAQRVVTLAWTDEVLALGLTPVAALADGRRGFPPHLADRLTGTIPLDGAATAPDLEAIAAARPDLIVADWFAIGSWAALERIAPTVMLQPAHWEWRQRVRDLGTTLGRETEAARVVDELDARIADARTAIAAALGTRSVALLRVYAREFRLYGFGFSGPLLYGDLGLNRPRIVSDLVWSTDMVRLSLEGLARVDADVLLLMTEEGVPISGQIRERLAHHPLWNSLPAVQAGRVIEVPNILMRGGVIARAAMVDLLQRELCR